MKWALMHATNQPHFWKMDQHYFTAELKYNHQSQSFRLTAGDKRLFFIEKTGFLQNKYLLKTEYSIVNGEVYPVKNWHSGIISIEGRKFNYVLKEDSLMLSPKKENSSRVILIQDADKLDQLEFFALLFSTLRLLTHSYASEANAILT